MSSALLAWGTPLGHQGPHFPLGADSTGLNLAQSPAGGGESVEGLLAGIRIQVESPGVGGLRWGLR